jgi:hypothetical protein
MRPGDLQQSNGNELRRQAGHDVPSVQTDDELLSTLATIARDVFPALLLPAARDPTSVASLVVPSHRLIGRSVDAHPLAVDFVAQIRGDALGELLAGDLSPRFFSFSAGLGGAVALDSLAVALIGSACARARLLHTDLTMERLMVQLTTLLDDLRAIGRNDSIMVPVAVALQGLAIEPGARFQLPWGLLRPMDQGALNAVGDAFQASGSVFVTNVDTSVAVGSASAPDGPPSPRTAALRAFNEDLDARLHKLSLTLLLAQDEPRIAAVPTRIVAVTPLFGVGWGARGHTPEPVLGRQSTLASDSAPSVEIAANLVDSRYGPTLAIPTRRLTSALSARHDVEDSLVDAVVAWESLFAGTDVGELSFRIAAAMAWLLGTDADDRLAIHREISQLYGLRSRILHRGRAGQDISTQRDRSVELGIRALGSLLREQPDLVADENRGKKLIMRGEAPDA